jgi:hypothetical protein
MGTYVGKAKLSRCADFERATLSLSGKDQFIFKDWATQPVVLSKEWYAQMKRLSGHYLEIGTRLNPADPIEFFHAQVIQGQPVPAQRCSEVADAFESLRDKVRSLDKTELAPWSVERPQSLALEYHLDAYVKELRACASGNRAFAYTV